MELLVCCVFAYWLVKHIPQLAGEAAAEWAYAQRGEESPAAAARRHRLKEAGIDPAAGGAFRQFAGNVWRDFWLDQDKAHAERRAGSGDDPNRPGLFRRLFDDWDAEVGRRANAWRDRARAGGPERGRPVGENPGREGGPGGADPHLDGPSIPADQQDPRFEATTVHDSDEYTVPSDLPGEEPDEDLADLGPIRVEAQPGRGLALAGPGSVDLTIAAKAEGVAEAEALKHELFGNCSQDPSRCAEDLRQARRLQARQPVRPPAAVGKSTDSHPHATTAVLDPPAPDGGMNPAWGTEASEIEIELAGGSMNAIATRGIHVTGVLSGAAETLAIYHETNAAIAEFQARLQAITNRMVNLGEQTLTIVQFAGGSSVVVRMSQAAEALAALRHASQSCGAEVLPLLVQTRNEFTRRNS